DEERTRERRGERESWRHARGALLQGRSGGSVHPSRASATIELGHRRGRVDHSSDGRPCRMERASPPACRTRSTQRVGSVVGLYVVRARVDVAPARRGRSGRRGQKPTAAQESGRGLPPPFSPPPTPSSVTTSRTAISGPTALTAAARTRLCAASSVASKT